MSLLVPADLTTWLESISVELSSESATEGDEATAKLQAACTYADGILAGYGTAAFDAATLKARAYYLAAEWLLNGRLISSSPILDKGIERAYGWLESIPKGEVSAPTSTGFWRSQPPTFSCGSV